MELDPHSDDEKMYGPYQLRLQMIMHFLDNFDQLKRRIIGGIRGEYGSRDSPVGHYSLRSWLEYMVKADSYGDLMCIMLISSMWAAKISVIWSRSLAEYKFRHQEPLKNCNFVLLFNCDNVKGHYNACTRSNLETNSCKSVREGEGYDKEVDGRERKARGHGGWVDEEPLITEPTQPTQPTQPPTPMISQDDNIARKARLLDTFMAYLHSSQIGAQVYRR